MNNLSNSSAVPANTSVTDKIPESDRTKVNVLWTGGFDSSYRMIQLSKLKVDIQPYYISEKRHSEIHELEAISAITTDIKNHPETKCSILPMITCKVTDIEPDETLTEAYSRLNTISPVGIQYEWLSRFAKSVPGLELSIEKNPLNKAYNCVQSLGKLIKIKKGEISYYVLDKKESNPDLYKIFGNYHFPDPLFETTKLQMVEDYKNLGFEHTMAKTWFCHTPVRNQPCGICNPCKSAIKEGLSFRLPPKAIKRYKNHLKYGNYKWYRLFIKWQIKIMNAF